MLYLNGESGSADGAIGYKVLPDQFTSGKKYDKVVLSVFFTVNHILV